jgi:anti-anti-sigma factor
MSKVDVEQINAVPIVHLNEDLDAANAAVVQRQLSEALGPDALTLVLDLGRTDYVDSAGIDMILRFSDLLDRRRARLILVIPEPSQLRRLFALVGLPGATVVRPSVEDALAI